MIEQIQIRGLHYLNGASDGLRQRTSRVSLLITGDVKAWRGRVDEVSDTMRRNLGLVLPVQTLDPSYAEHLLARVQNSSTPQQALANAILGLCVAIQREARDAVWAGRVTQLTKTGGQYDIRLALPWQRQAVLKDALQWAARWWLLWGSPTSNENSAAAILKQYRTWLETAQNGGLPPNTLHFALAAYERDWPVSVQDQILHIGWGYARKSLDSSFTGQTSQIATRIARDKSLTSRVLRQAGLPVPPSSRVRDWESAQKVAREFGWPVVIKPAALDQGTGVVPGIQDGETLRKAFDQAHKHSPGAIIVEKHIAGDDHRLLVVNEVLLMATRRFRGSVLGDGRHTIAELVARTNADPRRGSSKRSLMLRLVLDAEALDLLTEQALTPESIPQPEQLVYLRRTANISTGGTAEDVSKIIHPDNRLLAERAARVLGLDIAGVDFLCPDISRSWREVGGGICEVNAQPGFRPHWLGDPSRDINGEILDILFPERPPRIPTAAITGTKGKTTVAQMLHHIWQKAGFCTGLSCSNGTRLGDTWVHAKAIPGANTACQMLLPDPAVQALVLEISRQELLTQGHPLDRYDVAALLNVQDDHIGVDGIASLDEMARHKAQVLEHAAKAIVVNADDARCLQMGQLPGLPRKILVAASADNSAVLAHRKAGGHAVYRQTRDGLDWVCLAMGAQTEFLMPVNDIAATDHGRWPLMAQNALFAIALAWAQGVSLETIRHSVSCFQCSPEQHPGRYNRIGGWPFEILLDYAHTPEGVEALCEAIQAQRARQPSAGRHILVELIGNRRRRHVEHNAPLLARHFDILFISQDGEYLQKIGDDYKGEDPLGQMLSLFDREAGPAGGGKLRLMCERLAALQAGLDECRPGDTLVVLAEPEMALPILLAGPRVEPLVEVAV